MQTLVIGFGASGRSAAELLRKNGKKALIVDRDPKYGFPETVEMKEIEQVILSPGIPRSHPLVGEAVERGIEVIGEAEFAFRHLKNRAIGITGTNGKTTTTLMIQHLLERAGKKAVALGNIGRSLSSYALNPNPEDLLVVELSSFQLETMASKCLDAALLLNITPDHLDRYDSVREYAMAKCRIENCLKNDGVLWISNQVVQEAGDLLRSHNLFGENNAQAAAAVCRHFGIDEIDLSAFRKPAHRIEFVEEWEGIQFYNDSKATNIDSVRYAVAEIDGPIILLAGGVDKGASYRPWIADFCGKVKRIVAFGQAASKIECELKKDIWVDRVEGLHDAIFCAMRSAERGMKILLSPGCSSFDQFRNYEHRGEEFCRMVRGKIWIEERSF